jgi:hypothetical protein
VFVRYYLIHEPAGFDAFCFRGNTLLSRSGFRPLVALVLAQFGAAYGDLLLPIFSETNVGALAGELLMGACHRTDRTEPTVRFYLRRASTELSKD